MKEKWKDASDGIYLIEDDFYGLEIITTKKTSKFKKIILKIKAFFLNLLFSPWIRLKVGDRNEN